KPSILKNNQFASVPTVVWRSNRRLYVPFSPVQSFSLRSRQLSLTNAPFRDGALEPVTTSPVRQFVAKVGERGYGIRRPAFDTPVNARDGVAQHRVEQTRIGQWYLADHVSREVLEERDLVFAWRALTRRQIPWV